MTCWPWTTYNCDLDPKIVYVNQEHMLENVFQANFTKIYWEITEIFKSKDFDHLASCDLDLEWNKIILMHSRLLISTNISTEFHKDPSINSWEKLANTCCTWQTDTQTDTQTDMRTRLGPSQSISPFLLKKGDWKTTMWLLFFL